MIDYIYDFYKLYLGTNGSFTKRITDLHTKEETYNRLEKEKDKYNEYMIVGHINILNEDSIIDYGQIEHIDKPKKKRRIK